MSKKFESLDKFIKLSDQDAKKISGGTEDPPNNGTSKKVKFVTLSRTTFQTGDHVDSNNDENNDETTLDD